MLSRVMAINVGDFLRHSVY